MVSLGIKGDEQFDVLGLDREIKPQQDVTLVIRPSDGSRQEVRVLLRIDTAIEADYYRNGGILPFVLRDILTAAERESSAACVIPMKAARRAR